MKKTIVALLDIEDAFDMLCDSMLELIDPSRHEEAGLIAEEHHEMLLEAFGEIYEALDKEGRGFA